MALKTDDIDIDTLLISYELEKLNLDNIPDDILNLPELVKSEKDVDEDFSTGKYEKTPRDNLQDVKPDLGVSLKCDKNESNVEVKKLPSSSSCVCPETNLTKNKSNLENNKENIVIKEESSDSDSDEHYDSQETDDETEGERDDFPFTLRSRGPVKARKRSKKRYEEYAKLKDGCIYVELDKEKLLHKAGGQCIQLNNCQSIKNQISSTEPSLLNDLADQYYQNCSNNLNSPESGYATSPSSASPHLGDQSCSTFSIHKSFSDEEEKYILEGIDEMTAENKGGILNASANVEIIKQFLEGENPENVQEPLNGTYLQSSKQISLKCKPIGKVAKKRLYAELYKEKYEEEKEKIYRRLQQQHTEIIYVPKEENPKDQSNLHLAVLNSNIEEIYCIVEIHKQYNKPFSDINIRDKLGKTALDYALKLTREQEKFTLVVDYLKENTAQQGVSLKT